MPPKKSAPNVARLSTEDQIAYLFHQYEGFADWRIQVDERLGQVEVSNQEMAEGLKGLATSILGLKETAQVSSQISSHNHLLLQKVLLAVQGQKEDGLNVPGMADRMLKLEQNDAKQAEELSVLRAKDVEHDNFKFRVYVIAGIIASTLGGLSLRFAPYLSQLLTLVSP